MRSPRHTRWGVVGVFLLSLAIYLTTMAPTLTYGGDCGELVAASHTLGIAHPTGYPGYLLLGKLFSLLFPWGEIAFRYNLLSALCAAGAAAVTALTIIAINGSVLAGCFAGLTLALSYIFWSQAVIAEVYALNAFLFSLCLYFYQTWLTRRDCRRLFIAGAFLGLGLTNHLSMAFVVLVIFLSLFWRAARSSDSCSAWKPVCTTAACVLLPLVLYLYLPLRAAERPAMNWGDPVTWERFVAHVTARLYKAHMFGLPPSKIPARFGEAVFLFALQFLLGNVFACYGGICMLRERHPLILPTGLLFVAFLIVSLFYDVGDWAVYLVPAFLIWCIWMGAGVGCVERRMLDKCRASSIREKALGERMCVLSIATLLLALVTMQCYVTYPRANMRGHRYAREDALRVIQSTQGHGTIITGTDELLFSLWYLQHVEHRGTQLRTLAMPKPEEGWRNGGLQFAIEGALTNGKVYVSFWMPVLQSRYECLPDDLVIEIRKSNRAALSSAQWSPRAFTSYTFGKPRNFPPAKRGSVLRTTLVTTCVDTQPHASTGRYRFRLWAQPSDNSRMPTERQILEVAQKADNGWASAWTSTFLLPDFSDSGAQTAHAVPLWIPPHALPVRYRFYGRVEALHANAKKSGVTNPVGPWRLIGDVQVVDK